MRSTSHARAANGHGDVLLLDEVVQLVDVGHDHLGANLPAREGRLLGAAAVGSRAHDLRDRVRNAIEDCVQLDLVRAQRLHRHAGERVENVAQAVVKEHKSKQKFGPKR